MPVVSPDILRVSTEKDIILLIITNFSISIWLLAIFERNAPICGENIKIINDMKIKKISMMFATELTKIFCSSLLSSLKKTVYTGINAAIISDSANMILKRFGIKYAQVYASVS
jgi:hypothetical protein